MTEQERIDACFDLWHTLKTLDSQIETLLRGSWRSPRTFSVEFDDQLLALRTSVAALRATITDGRAFAHGTNKECSASDFKVRHID